MHSKWDKMCDQEIFLKILGKRIKEKRIAKQISVKDIAKLTGINISYLYKIERGQAYGIALSKIFVIANVLDIPPHILVEGL